MDTESKQQQQKVNSSFNDTLRDIFVTPLGELLRRDREEEETRSK